MPGKILMGMTVNIGYNLSLMDNLVECSDDLYARARRLEPQALTELHDQLYPVVYRYVCFRLEDHQVVEDIAAETFLRLLDALHERPDSIREPKAWLMGTASNLVYEHLRQRYRHPVENLDAHLDLTADHNTEAIVEKNHADWLVHEAMRELTDDQQHVLALRFSHGMSISETARLVKKSVNAVKVLQYRAMSSLRRILEKKRDL